jgi:site-specific recombinase XerD
MERAGPPVRLSDTFNDYKATYMASRNMAARTRVEYGRDIGDLIGFLKETIRLDEPPQIELKHLEHYLADLDRRGLSGSSRRRKAAAIRSFFSFLEGHGYVPVDIATRLRPPGRSERQPRVLNETEYRRLQDACRFHPRDQAIIELFLQTGMRLSELARLRVSELSLPARIGKEKDAAGSVRVLGKGAKERMITVNWKASKALKSYLDNRPKAESDSLFITKFGEPMGARAVQDVVKKYLREAEIRDASVHTLRHTFGTHQVKKGTNLRVVQEAMGHADLKTTSIYVHLAREQMDEQLQANAL